MSSSVELVLGELRGVVESIELELSKTSPDRKILERELQRALILLSRFREHLRAYTESLENTSLLRFFQGLQKLSIKQQQGIQMTPDEVFNIFSSLRVPKVPEKDIEHASSVIELTLTVMDYAADRVPPEYIKEKVRGVLRDLSMLLSRIEVDYDLKPALPALVSELVGIAKGGWGLGDRWVVATCYLSAFEILLNKALKSLQLEEETEGLSFKDKVVRLLEALERRGVNVGVLLKKLPDDLWDLRNKVIHGGYEPTDSELSMIVRTVKEMFNLFAQIQ